MKHILITGASKGIGAETARVLAPGNTIFINYHASDNDAQMVAEHVEAAGGIAHLVKADISKESGCRALYDAVIQKTEVLDVLVNNAGALIKRTMLPDIEWDFMVQTFSLNTFSVIMLCKLFVGIMEHGEDPCIVNITTIGLRQGSPTASVYSASKGAVDAFTRSIANELAPRIRVNAIAPGLIETPFHHGISSAEQIKQYLMQTPMKCQGQPIHIARAVKFVIENEFLCGETIDINVGRYMR